MLSCPATTSPTTRRTRRPNAGAKMTPRKRPVPLPAERDSVAIELSAVVVAVAGDEPRVLAVASDAGPPAAPFVRGGGRGKVCPNDELYVVICTLINNILTHNQ